MAKDPYRYFRVEARDLLTQMSQAVLAAEQAAAAQRLELPAKLLRLAHTLKGAASVVRLPEIAGLAHAIEDLLTPLRDSASAPSKDDLDALLVVIDEASQAVAELASPPGPPAPPSAAAPGAPPAPHQPGRDPAAPRPPPARCLLWRARRSARRRAAAPSAATGVKWTTCPCR
ncbi:Hpt domain-containing protein [Roseateles sp. SL47]|uniref:Hpt domain-containing protein n=1 Tax=Roseateles sp. SL47 TaxID=2995138 RepID=UPI00226D4C75|nr:Hpt domain-containing protein [Roseateles sp. SL47]WAC73026.1 Hpt domain-containing protein [Roseateles sp. SL47]